MSQESATNTSPTLLQRLRDPMDRCAWEAFVRRYGPKIYAWCLVWGAQNADAEDVTQKLLLEMPRKMRAFVYDPAKTFRGWLWKVAKNAHDELRKGHNRGRQGSGDSRTQDRLSSVEAAEDLLTRLGEEFDLELLEEAKTQVQLRVMPQTWKAFQLAAVEDRPGKEVAEALGISVAAVYVYRNRVQNMLREEVRRLGGE
jgi:RNA polymerase sigma factor (sigma-70 family)